MTATRLTGAGPRRVLVTAWLRHPLRHTHDSRFPCLVRVLVFGLAVLVTDTWYRGIRLGGSTAAADANGCRAEPVRPACAAFGGLQPWERSIPRP